MHRRLSLHLVFTVIAVFICATTGCTHEKAQAIKTAATTFALQADTGLTAAQTLFEKSILVAERDDQAVDSVVRGLMDPKKAGRVNEAWLTQALDAISLDETQTAAVEELRKEVGALRRQYRAFAAMYRSFPRGSYFAGGAVKRSLRHAVNLTLQLVRLAEMIQKTRIGRLMQRRAEILGSLKAALVIQDADVRQDRLKELARGMLELKRDETALNEAVVRKCLAAAGQGNKVIDLIKRYNEVTVGDILTAINEILTLAADISFGYEPIADLLNTFKKIDKTVRNDPYWKDLIEIDVYSDS